MAILYVHNKCPTCRKIFPAGPWARNQHCRDTGHDLPEVRFCEECSFGSDDQEAYEEHMDTWNHWPIKCADCELSFPATAYLEEHIGDQHRHCYSCDRRFRTTNEMKMHLNSRIHRGHDALCPFCDRGFVTATGIAHHLEQGSCPDAQDLDRDELFAVIRAKDPDGLITNELLDWMGSTRYESSGASWNGSSFECYLCHRRFRMLTGLNQHLNSPAHQQALYHCPNTRCGSEFKALAGLFNHLESEACGFMRFEELQSTVEDLVMGNQRIAFY